ncbi:MULTISPECIES: glycoside hydrolase 43 family protein [Actinosynnema]|uniref:glycoside hydrolase family 43 protein n=1 Tax=Actinosynnema TaxID=40566 RepID=UPI0020A2D3F5|nr:glycoside hydrolase 43 family protein [Actinosynnema pretiosum]MCP2094340.1 Beta-xylosidase [Actinosynnema pretiosum]
MSEHSRRRALQAGLGLVAGASVFGLGGAPAAAEGAPPPAGAPNPPIDQAPPHRGRLPWVADLGDGRYRNPVLFADWSDPDAVRVGEHFYLVASTFNRIPGLPVLRSTDLVNWSLIGHALTELEPLDHFARPQRGGGVWAPALRHHDGRFWIFYPDPDHGIFVTTATDPRGPWTRPHALKPGRGLIDPCPLWDDDGQAYLVHAWAKSRAGINNLLTLHRMSPDGKSLLDEGQVVVDGNLLPGYTTLEGPKLYKRDGWYWIFAPAGGVKQGWQSAFRSRSIHGPYEDRIVLAQGDTDVNGPHQGAWVSTATGEDWFLHFQDREAYGRVVHLQPLRWRDDGWPVMGVDDGAGLGSPVAVHAKPRVAPSRITAPPTGDDFAGPALGAQWVWQANADRRWWSLRGRGLTLACAPSPDTSDLRLLPNVLGQRFPAEVFTATTSLTLSTTAPDARAGLVVLGDTYAWVGLRHDGDRLVLVHRTAGVGAAEVDAVAPTPVPPRHRGPVRLRVEVGAGASCRFLADLDGWTPLGEPFPATPGRWIGATIGLFATAPEGAGSGVAEFGGFTVTP